MGLLLTIVLALLIVFVGIPVGFIILSCIGLVGTGIIGVLEALFKPSKEATIGNERDLMLFTILTVLAIGVLYLLGVGICSFF